MIFHDVKPQNIAVGEDDENKIFFFDFAFSQFYVNALGETKPRERANHFDGTPEYFAFGPLNGLSHVRKDDLISFGICLLDLNDAYIPWFGETNQDDSIYRIMNTVLEHWERSSIEVGRTYIKFWLMNNLPSNIQRWVWFFFQEICETSDDPDLFMKYFNQLDSIESHKEPDYDGLVELFASRLTKEELESDDLYIYDPETEYIGDDFADSLKGYVIDDRFEIGYFLDGYYSRFLFSGKETSDLHSNSFMFERIEFSLSFFFRLGLEDRRRSCH